jgi:hypothetical protein
MSKDTKVPFLPVTTIYDLCMKMNTKLDELKDKVNDVEEQMNVSFNTGVPSRYQLNELIDSKIEKGAEMIIRRLRERGYINNFTGF